MFRVAVIVAVLAVTLLAGGDLWAAAGNQWPAFQPAPLPGVDFRGPGGYLSWIKIFACWAVFLAWVGTTEWLSIDCLNFNLKHLRWNPIVFGTFLAAFVLLWLLPSFWIGFPLLVIAYVAPLATYIVYRNSKVDNDQRVLTPEHLRYWFATKLSKVGMKIEVEKLDPHETGPPIKVFARGGADQQTDNARLLQARQSRGLRAAREILADGFIGRATAIMLDYTQQSVGIRALIDGMWMPWESRNRETGDAALEALKLLCGLNPQDRQGRQEGIFTAEYESVRYGAVFASQGTPTGERAMIQFEENDIRFKTLDELGMRTKMQEQFGELLELPRGFLLFSAVAGGGLRSTMDVVLHNCDRFIREFAAIEEETNRYEEVENVHVTTYRAADGQSPADVLPRFFRTEPHVAIVRDLVDAPTVELMCDEIVENRLMIGAVRAKDCAEALLQVLALGVPPERFAKSITAVINQRLVRKLCDACKQAYAPPPQTLRQLGIPAGRVQAFYRSPQPNAEAPKRPCRACNGIGYLGRTAIFELLVVGEAVRKVLAAEAKPEQIRKAARQDGMKSLQEEGILLVVRGVTSLPELMRVLKQ